MFTSGKFRFFALFASLLVAFSVVAVDTAEARRGGSFGSRGMRTMQSVPATRTSPTTTAPVNRTMTEPASANRVGAPAPAAPRPGLFSGGLMRGLFLGGLFGLLLGTGFGGFGGMLSLLFQVLLIGGLLWFLFGRRRMATAGGPHFGVNPGGNRPQASPYAGRTTGSSGGRPATTPIKVSDADLAVFETRLAEVQDAFSHADGARMSRVATKEMVDFFGEELSENNRRGVRNEVFDVKLLSGSAAEAWREGATDYASVAMRYESRDVTRDKATGKVVAGDEQLTETTEIWTFRRDRGGDWVLSAIQET